MPKEFVKAMKNVKRAFLWGTLPADQTDDIDTVLNTNRAIVSMCVGTSGAYTAIDENGIILTDYGSGESDGDSWDRFLIPKNCGWQKITQKADLVVGLHSDGTIGQWGGDIFFVNTYPPPGGTFIDVACTDDRGLAVNTAGELEAWGDIDAMDPDDIGNVPAGSDYLQVGCGIQEFAAALKDDGTVVTWGALTGVGETYEVPGSLTDVVRIVVGDFHVVCLKSDGTVITFGDGVPGGNEIPVEEEETVFTDIAAGEHWTMALRENGSAAFWPNTNPLYTDRPKGYNITSLWGGHETGMIVKKIYTPKIVHFDSSRQKLTRMKISKYDDTYQGDVEVTFSGIVTNPDHWPTVYDPLNRYTKVWTDPNKTFTVPYVGDWVSPPYITLDFQNYRDHRWGVDWQEHLGNDTDEEFEVWDGWLPEFAPTNRWVQSDHNFGDPTATDEHIRVDSAGYLTLRWFADVIPGPGYTSPNIYPRVVFAIDSAPHPWTRDGEYMWSPKSSRGKPTVDVTVRRRTLFALYGGPAPDRIRVTLPNLIKQENIHGSSFEFVSETDTKSIFIPSEDIGSDWQLRTFNDDSWTTGTGGVGFALGEFQVGVLYLVDDEIMGFGPGSEGKYYGCDIEYTPGDLTTRPIDGGDYYDYWGGGITGSGGYFDLITTYIGPVMFDINPSCYIRIPFTIATQGLKDSISVLTLSVRFDDGFVAYINGTEVARDNFTGTPAFNSVADAAHVAGSGMNDYNVSAYTSSLLVGENILAIQGLNFTVDDPDLVIGARLVGMSGPISFDSGSPYLAHTTGYGGNAEITRNGLFKDGIY